MYSPTISTSASSKRGGVSRGTVEVPSKCGLMPLRRHTRRMVVALRPRYEAKVRVLQRAAATGCS
ncbi:hypothetical protein D9M69_622560 [compost metagenome]